MVIKAVIIVSPMLFFVISLYKKHGSNILTCLNTYEIARHDPLLCADGKEK